MANVPINETAVPGTVRLVDSRHELEGVNEVGDIILIPQPSSDPEDPLNWSQWRKSRSMYLTHLYTFVVGWASSCVYSILVDISRETGLSVNMLNSGSGIMLLFFGWGALLAQPIALTFGRRGTLLISLVLTVAVSVWTAYCPTYAAWVANRVVLGFVGCPIEVVPEMVVTDLYFNHQRGHHIGLYAFSLATGSYLCSLFSGLINDTMGWKWVMYWCAIINAIAALLFFFGFEETMYHRNTGFEATSEHSDPTTPTNYSAPSLFAANKASEAKELPSNPHASSPTIHPKPRSYWQKLALFRVSPGQPRHFWIYIYLPFKNYYNYPIILWASVYHGIAIICFNAMNATASLILTAPPYNFKSSYVGLTYIGPVIGAIFGAFWSGLINDEICLAMARRNKGGLREAEHRLYAAAIMCIIPPAGFIIWGIGASHQVHWVGLVFGMSMLGFTLPVGGGLIINYATDSYKELQGSTMTSLNVLRSTMAFGFGYAVTPWLDKTGIQNTFITWSLMSFVLFGTFLPMIFFGKKLRVQSTAAFWKDVKQTVDLYH